MWTLTSTNRVLRDHGTCALYWFGCADPETLFELTIDSLSVNDPYVPERMLAACYGVSMGLWADPRGSKLRSTLPRFASKLVDNLFIPKAPYSTFHALTRGYALGVVTLARKIDPSCILPETLPFLSAPFTHIPSPFPPAGSIDDAQVAGADEAMHMDFSNYTLGGLVGDRRNYDFEHEAYKQVRRQVEFRIVDLGYSSARFSKIDRVIGGSEWRRGREEGAKVDRYGKKYSWIAFFEMYALRADAGLIADWRDPTRPPEAGIDPSFPDPPLIHSPNLPNIFSTSPREPLLWMSGGPTPDYSNLIEVQEIDGHPGPWVLLQGYVEQSALADTRRVFSFLRGVLVRRDETCKLIRLFDSTEYPGNHAIPEPLDDHYTYAGEIPWSTHFGAGLRDAAGRAGPDQREAFERHDGRQWLPGITVEIPAYDFAWESYHSPLNQTGGVTVPAPSLCERLSLSNRRGEWDYYDRDGRVATLYRQFKNEGDSFNSHLLYLRADLMANYLTDNLDLVWFVWGERNIKSENGINTDLHDAFVGHRHIHRFARKWEK